MPPWLDTGRARTLEYDRRGAIALHRAGARPRLLKLLVGCSRLADGPLWLALIVVLPLVDATAGSRCARLIAGLGGANLLIYWCLKRSTRRRRPFVHCEGIEARAKVPDTFSFPSGHTLHAVAFALLLSAFYPSLAPLLWGFALVVGLSRVVLGLHYPSDVLIGALIGATTASLALLRG